MDHSSLIYLTDRQGRTLTTMAHSTTPEQMAERIRKYL
jgi:cytochrome oxidase Cu insertion factor (SCO1/SenC/PrrC family)